MGQGKKIKKNRRRWEDWENGGRLCDLSNRDKRDGVEIELRREMNGGGPQGRA